MSNPIITVDSDNAKVWLYVDEAREQGVPEAAIARLHRDARAIAQAFAYETKASWIVDVEGGRLEDK